MAGEYEIKNAQAMKIMDCFGAGGSFTEYYAMDFNDDVVLMGHDGPGTSPLPRAKPRFARSASITARSGADSPLKCPSSMARSHCFPLCKPSMENSNCSSQKADSVPGPILEIGNTNSRYRFSVGAKTFLNAWNAEGPAHHCAIGVGHISGKLRKLAQLLSIDCTVIG